MIITDIPTLSEIAERINEVTMDTNDFSIVFKVKDQETLNKINEDIFYRIHANENGENIVKEPKEVMVNILGINFEYVVEDNTATSN